MPKWPEIKNIGAHRNLLSLFILETKSVSQKVAVLTKPSVTPSPIEKWKYY